MIFVTLGSQKFPFDRLLRKIDELIADGTITDEVLAQTGYSTYVPENFQIIPFMDRDTFAETMAKASFVITHAGTGAIIGAVKNGKKVIAVPRLAKFGEHVDDHQLQIVDQFAQMELIEPCYDTEALDAALAKAHATTYRPYVSNTQKLLGDIEAYLEKVL